VVCGSFTGGKCEALSLQEVGLVRGIKENVEFPITESFECLKQFLMDYGDKHRVELFFYKVTGI